ncbi:sulfatase [Akkermansiaceae bacterium]|nr:sulfatase [Akkermansiaceae bacterium]MDB4759147.1 sulfatase [Akkermansiaceae bacterium]
MRIGALLCLLLGGAKAELPNILLIVSEDNGPELGCYRDPYVKTPVLDQLAKEGTRFANAFTPYSVCSPSRACFLTGLDPGINGQLGLATHKYAMYQKWPNVFSLLKEGGYRTGLIGKLHVNPEQAFGPHIDFRAIRGANFGRKDLKDYAEKSAEFFEEGETPFFLSINYPDAHFPLTPQVGEYPKDEDLLKGDEVKPLPWVGCDSERLRTATANYYNCMSRLDSLVGDLLKRLEKSGKRENTFIIYIGDHGAQFSRGKTSVYDAGLRIPMILHWPGKVNTGVRNEMASVVDLLPTICEAAKVKPPELQSGRSLWPLLEGQNVAEWRKEMLAVTSGAAPAIACLQFALRTEEYKLIHTPQGQGGNRSALAYLNQYNAHYIAGSKMEEISQSSEKVQKSYEIYAKPPEYELYDLKKDPFEFVNLADDPKLENVLKLMKQRLVDYLKKTKDPFAKEENVQGWIEQEAEARGVSYRKRQDWVWSYLKRHRER